jgi:hypothetical protein
MSRQIAKFQANISAISRNPARPSRVFDEISSERFTHSGNAPDN